MEVVVVVDDGGWETGRGERERILYYIICGVCVRLVVVLFCMAVPGPVHRLLVGCQFLVRSSVSAGSG